MNWNCQEYKQYKNDQYNAYGTATSNITLHLKLIKVKSLFNIMGKKVDTEDLLFPFSYVFHVLFKKDYLNFLSLFNN